MKNVGFIFTLLFLSRVSPAQTNDSFSDGDFTANPTWSGSASLFIVNSSQQLQLNNTIASSSFLTTAFSASSINDFEWQVFVKQAFAPSSSNYGRVYLTSDESDLTRPLHGYYLQFGEAGSLDAVELFVQSGSTSTSVCRATNAAIAASFAIRVKVTRDNAGLWKLFVDYTGGTRFVLEATGTDSTLPNSSFLGVFCAYTLSNAAKFYYDDFYAGPAIPDVPPPGPAHTKDLIITEILADPDPSIGLPEYEYIELYNRSSNAIDIGNWTLSDGTTTATFASHGIQPQQYWIITSSTAATTLQAFGNTIGTTPFPSLNNTEDYLALRSSEGVTIDSVHYTTSFYRDPDKAEGGWSLELIDPSNPCGEEDNWTASEDPRGGTPGKQNSVYASKPDVVGPRIITLVPIAPNKIHLTFNEKLESQPPPPDSFVLTPFNTVDEVVLSQPGLRQLELTLHDTLTPRQLYTLTIQNVFDCSGNPIDDGTNEFTFALPEQPDSLDILVNEILFNPRPGGVDFVEVYNTSPKYIDLKDWKLANYDHETPTDVHSITVNDFVLAPNSYLAFTADPAALKNNYPLGAERNFFETSLPTLPDDEGSIAIIAETGKTVDCFTYSKSFHSELLKDDEGVSLERISLTSPTNDAQNWKSASVQSGYATPGKVNSNARPERLANAGSVTVEPEVFIPGSGMQDFAKINYAFEQPGYIANIKILDHQGRLVKTICNNDLLGFEGFYRWDGERDDGSKARIGYYIVWFEVFDTDGMVKAFRKRVVVMTK